VICALEKLCSWSVVIAAAWSAVSAAMCAVPNPRSWSVADPWAAAGSGSAAPPDSRQVPAKYPGRGWEKRLARVLFCHCCATRCLVGSSPVVIAPAGRPPGVRDASYGRNTRGGSTGCWSAAPGRRASVSRRSTRPSACRRPATPSSASTARRTHRSVRRTRRRASRAGRTPTSRTAISSDVPRSATRRSIPSSPPAGPPVSSSSRWYRVLAACGFMRWEC